MIRKIVVVLLACISMSACRSVKYVELPSSHSSIEVSLRYDSISRDHIRYQEVRDGKEQTIDSTVVNHYIVSKDTVLKVDSIPVPVPVPVPGEMTKRQQFLYNSGQIAWILFAILALAGIIYIVIKAIKR